MRKLPPGVEPAEFEGALKAFARAVGSDWVFDDQITGIHSYRDPFAIADQDRTWRALRSHWRPHWRSRWRAAPVPVIGLTQRSAFVLFAGLAAVHGLYPDPQTDFSGRHGDFMSWALTPLSTGT